jgi:hypothetical protein
LAESIGRFLGTPRGRRFAAAGRRLTRERLADVQKLARRERDRWHAASANYRLSDRPQETPARITPRRTSRASRTVAVAPRPKIRRAKRAPLRFLLDRASPVVDAPSIGAATAGRLAKVGIRTVADLLAANPDSTAEECGEPRLAPAVIARWQSEARLACRLPNLRSGAARLLVACGLTEPEQVAGANIDELHAKVRAYCRSPEGRRLIGKRESPSRDRIAGWVRRAAHMRPLEAA